MNLLSEHNRILRVGEGGSQEYFAGPNINITDHVISGKYWDNEINSAISSTSGDIVNEAFNQSTAWSEEQGYLTAHQDVSNLPYVQNSALEFSPQGLISGISGSGIYATSAENAFTADTAYFAYNAEHADSADFVATANFANSASSALNAEVANVAYTALTAQFLDGGWEHDVDGFITAYNNSAFAGNGGGGRYEGISPIVVNNEEMRISAKSALLGVQDPLYFVEDSETATVIGIHDSAFPTFEGTEDGKISAINGSALNADPVVDYSAGNNIDITDYVISVTGSVQSADRADYAVSATSSHFSHSAIEAGSAGSATYDNLGREITATYLTAVTGDNTPYSAGANIDITDHVVSGKDWTSEIQEASANAVAQIPTGLMVTSALEYDPDNHFITAYNGSAIGKEETEYSAGPNIVINNHIIGLDSAVELTNITGNRGAILDPSGLYVSNLNQTDYTEIGLDHVVSTDGSASIGWQLDNKEISVSDDSGNGDYAILHMSTADVLLEERHQEPTPDKVYSLTGACTSAISAINMINSGDSQAYSAGANIDITDHVVSGKDWTTEIQAASANAVTEATNTITAVKFANSASALTTSAGWDVTEYTAGTNINITNHVISGKNWTTDIQNASSYAYNQATAQIPSTANLPYVQNTALKIDSNNKLTGISGYEIGSTGSLYPQIPVVGVDGVSITKQNDTVLIGLSANVGNYVGIDPIVVDNDEGAISANTARFGVQAPLYFVTDTPNATIIGIEGTDAGALSASSYSTSYIPGAWYLSSYNNVSVTYTGAFVSGAQYRRISMQGQPVTGPYSSYTELTSGGFTVTGNNNGSGSATINHLSIKISNANSYTEIRPAFITVADSNGFTNLYASDLKCMLEAAAWVSAHSGSL